LSKPKESSGRKKNIPPKKLRMTWKRPAIDCKARIRIIWLAALSIVRIER
ncbi:6968_t:CDS:2, partial [Racocetra persica]